MLEYRDQLHAVMVARGFVLEVDEVSAAFGSWYRDYVSGQRRFRLIWDGRDEWFVLQGGSAWGDLAIARPADLAESGLDKLLAAVE